MPIQRSNNRAPGPSHRHASWGHVERALGWGRTPFIRPGRRGWGCCLDSEDATPPRERAPHQVETENFHLSRSLEIELKSCVKNRTSPRLAKYVGCVRFPHWTYPGGCKWNTTQPSGDSEASHQPGIGQTAQVAAVMTDGAEHGVAGAAGS